MGNPRGDSEYIQSEYIQSPVGNPRGKKECGSYPCGVPV